jgi:MoxR-like ATPase
MAAKTLSPSQTVTLPASGSWPRTRHQFDEKSIWAIKAAVYAQRPLLVRGEPGTGKSQLARAAAYYLERAFISEVVHARSECHDLQFHFDTVARLGEAQTLGILGEAGKDKIIDALDPISFISPGALWWAFNWDGAKKQFGKSNKAIRRPEEPPEWEPKKGTVLLIDEIDKADADLPNGLLETLGNGAFTVPYLDEPVRVGEDDPVPLVVITTNEERELPAAFIRRCLVLHLNLPEDGDELANWLCERGRVHFESKCSDELKKQAAHQLVKDRIEAKKLSLPAPGQAEYLDILRAVIGIAQGDKKKQLEALEAISGFALIKHADGYRN